MVPVLPLLLAGGGVWAGLRLSKRLKSGKKAQPTIKGRKARHRKFFQRVSKRLESGKKAQPTIKDMDARYQKFFREKIDPLLGTKKRSLQIQEFSGTYTLEEADINRRLGLTLVNANLAVFGATLFLPLSWLSAAGLVYIMWPLLRRNIRILLREKRLKYRLVATLAIWTGLAAGYYVVSNTMAVVVFTAFKIAARTEAHSQSLLMDAFALRPPPSVWVQMDGVEMEISFSQLRIGDIILLSAGQTVPIDGHVVEGMATIDQHVLTGESQPVEKSPGDSVFANTLVLTGRLHVRVEQTGSETAAAQIVNILGNASSHRLEHEARSEQLADKLTVPVLAASGLALVTVGSGGAVAIMNSGFGSTLFLSGPLSMLSHLNLASHHGILVKDGRSLERLHRVDTVVFDKTGTLTLEEPEVSRIHCCAGWQREQVLAYAALAECRQTHPVARAILTAAEQHDLSIVMPDSAAYEVGFGITVCHQGQTVQVGSQRFMRQSQVDIPAEMEALQAACREAGNSLVMVAVDGRLAGALELQAQLRPETVELIDRLHRRGLKLCILSGDHHQPTQHLAKRLNIDDFFAEVLPEGKADMIRQLQQKGRTICFVGDGINDAIALQQADISVSLRGATSVATDSAQIVLMKQSLQQLDQLFEIANGFNKNLDQTMRLAYIPGSVLIGGVFLLHFGMPAALLLYSVGVTTAMSNALSPLRQLRKNGEDARLSCPGN